MLDIRGRSQPQQSQTQEFLISMLMVNSIIPDCPAEKGSDWRLFSPEVTAGGYFLFMGAFLEALNGAVCRPDALGIRLPQSHLSRLTSGAN